MEGEYAKLAQHGQLTFRSFSFLFRLSGSIDFFLSFFFLFFSVSDHYIDLSLCIFTRCGQLLSAGIYRETYSCIYACIYIYMYNIKKRR